MRALLVALAVPDPASLRAALQAALGATSVDLCQAPEAAVTWLENRPCDLVAVAGDEPGLVEVIARLRRVSRTLPLLALVPDGSSRTAGAAWLAGADEVAGISALVAGMTLEGLDEVRHPERDVLRRLQRLWHAGPGDALRQALAGRLASRFRDVGLSAEGLAGLTTQDVESPQSAALVVNATTDAEALVLGIRRVKRTYPGLAIVVVADAVLHDAFRRAGADECLGAGPDPDAVLHAVARAQAACRAALDLETARSRETRLRALVEHLPEAVMLVSPEHAVLAVNLAALRLIGAQDARQVLGSPLDPWLDLGQDQLEGALQLVDGVATGATRELFTRTRHLADPRPLLLRAVPFQREGGGAPAALIVLRDAQHTPAIDAITPSADQAAAMEAERESWRTQQQAWEEARAAWEIERADLTARVDTLTADAETSLTLAERLAQTQAALADAEARLQGLDEARARLARVDALGIDIDALPGLVDAATRLAVLEHEEVPALLARAQAQQHAHDEQLARLTEVVASLEGTRAERDAAIEAASLAQARVDDLEARLAGTALPPVAAATPAVASPRAEAGSATSIQRWMLEDVARVGFVRTTTDGRVIDANDRAARLCGLPDATALLDARHLPDAIAALAEGEQAATVRFESCLLTADGASRWIAGARLAAVDGADDFTWLLAECPEARTADAARDNAALLEALADECLAIVEAPSTGPRGPRALDAQPAAEPAGQAALARARVLLAQLATVRRRRQARVAVDDLTGHLTALDPLLARLATDDVNWVASCPDTVIHVPVAPPDVERCLTAAVATMGEALPLGGHLSLRVASCDEHVAGDAHAPAPMRRPAVEIRLEAQGFGVRAPVPSQGLRDLVSGIGGTLETGQDHELSAHLVVRLPRALAIAHAA
ncbi:hypothetical protein TBR22_A05360 [Luteitalea sp. TBR-22]|uniref:PAS domain-containing protein n=1 Tax=Luteitalea sp. TBR-22 TaxID=2802971 RepID=UPI001AF8234C|nr:PAS domain-containing protein [Luteitalea sp. TBR-22]BCS31336.1 hypothetical protein TBR22_A05360 [Luteitalea sp. TBR-22]